MNEEYTVITCSLVMFNYRSELEDTFRVLMKIYVVVLDHDVSVAQVARLI